MAAVNGESSDANKRSAPEDDDIMGTTIKSKIRIETVREILKSSFKDPKTKIYDDSLAIVNEVVRLLTLEAALRSTKQTIRDHQTTVELDQVEKILPQLMLDFP